MNNQIYFRDFEAYKHAIEKQALLAFFDDLGDGDITTEAVFSDDPTAKAVIVAEEDCMVAGLLEAIAILEAGKLKFSGISNGDFVKKGETILSIEGSLKQILARERVALNYLSRMSGIATLSRRLSDAHGKKVLFLRKTDPGLLFSEKLAVSLGGCLPHRMNLSDGILIKDNHIDHLAEDGSREEAIVAVILRVDKYRQGKKFLPIEIEVDTLKEAEIAAKALKDLKGPNIILLDNMSPKQVSKTAKAVQSVDSTIVLEASGGITEGNIGAYLKSGADYVSTSMFMSAKPCSFKLEIIR